MILTELAAGIIRIPLKTPFVTALRRVETVESVRVTLRTAMGMVGTGEAPPTKAITGEDCGTILAAMERIRPALLHTEFATVDAAALFKDHIAGNFFVDSA